MVDAESFIVRMNMGRGIAKNIKPSANRCMRQIVSHRSFAIDIATEKERLSKQLQQLHNQKKGLDAKLSNAQFIEKAPPAIVDKVKTEAADIASEIQSIDHQIAQLG